MLKRLVRSACAVTLMGGSLIAVAATPAGAMKFFVHGNVHCAATGKTMYAPTLKNGVSQTVRAVIKGTLNCTGPGNVGETGRDGMKVVTGKFKAQSEYFGGDCQHISWADVANPSITMHISWVSDTGARIRDTDMSWGAPLSAPTSPLYGYEFAGGQVTTVGVSGSYFGATAGANFVGDIGDSVCLSGKKLKDGWTFGGASELTFESPPWVSVVSPDNAVLGTQNLNIALTGQDFRANDTLSFSGDGITVNSTTFVSDTELDANISIDPGALAGTRDVIVTNSTLGVGTCASCFMVAPIVTSVSANSFGQGASDQVVTISGSGFAPGAYATTSNGITVNWTAYQDPNTLTASLSVSPAAPLGAHDVTVTDPGFGVGTCTGCVTVNAGPTVTSTTPNSRGSGSVNQVIAVNGSNFSSGAVVSFPGTGITVSSTTFVSSNKLNATVTIAPGTPNGVRAVTVTNPDGGSGTCANCFTVNKGPTVTDWQVQAGYFTHYVNENHHGHYESRYKFTATVYIIGTGFTPTSTVSYASDDVTVNTTQFVSSTKIKQTVTVDIWDYQATALPGDRAVTVTNPDGGSFTCQGAVVIFV